LTIKTPLRLKRGGRLVRPDEFALPEMARARSLQAARVH
jgi:hypothetical protein